MNKPIALVDALDLSEIVNTAFNKETNILLLDIENCQVLNNLTTGFAKLVKSHQSISGVIATDPSDKAVYDLESRYSWSWSGTIEGPVTSAAHIFLTKYWGDKLNKKKMNLYQCSARTSFRQVELIDDNTLSISCKAQSTLEGIIKI